MTEQAKTPVTVLGLGDMGRALAGALLAAGHPVTVWNRSPGKAGGLVAEGAVEAGTAREAVAASPLVIACLLDDASVYGVLDPVADALAGRTLVNLSTGSPDQAREMAAWARERDAAGFLDGGIMAVPSMVGGPDAFILYSGSRDGFGSYEGTLTALGAATYVGADAGLAALYDLALLSGMYGVFGGFLQAVAMVGTEQVKATEFTTSLLVPWLRAMVGSTVELAGQIDSGDYTAQESTLAMQAPAIGHIIEAGEAVGVSGALLAPLEALMRQRVADGHGGDDVSSVIELLGKPAAR